jgi:Transposase DDE domain
MVLRLPADHQDRPGLADHPRLEQRARRSQRAPGRRRSAPDRAWPRDLLADKGFNGKTFAAQLTAYGTAVLVPPAKDQRAATRPILLKVIARWRNRIETTFSEITDLIGLARHGARTFWGLLTRTAATIAAHTLLRVCLGAS